MGELSCAYLPASYQTGMLTAPNFFSTCRAMGVDQSLHATQSCRKRASCNQAMSSGRALACPPHLRDQDARHCCHGKAGVHQLCLNVPADARQVHIVFPQPALMHRLNALAVHTKAVKAAPFSALLGPVRASEGRSRKTCTQRKYKSSIASQCVCAWPPQDKAVQRSWPRPPSACGAVAALTLGGSSRYEGVGAPGSQLPDFMHTREPLLLNARGIDGRAAARAMKAEEVMVLDIMVALIPPARQMDPTGAGGANSELDDVVPRS